MLSCIDILHRHYLKFFILFVLDHIILEKTIVAEVQVYNFAYFLRLTVKYANTLNVFQKHIGASNFVKADYLLYAQIITSSWWIWYFSNYSLIIRPINNKYVWVFCNAYQNLIVYTLSNSNNLIIHTIDFTWLFYHKRVMIFLNDCCKCNFISQSSKCKLILSACSDQINYTSNVLELFFMYYPFWLCCNYFNKTSIFSAY